MNQAHTKQDKGREGRIHRRVPLKVSVDMGSGIGYKTWSGDISLGGLFVASYSLKPPGTVLDIEFTLPDEEAPVRTQAEVRWVRENKPGSFGQTGMGLQFVRLSEREQQRVAEFIETFNDEDELEVDESDDEEL